MGRGTEGQASRMRGAVSKPRARRLFAEHAASGRHAAAAERAKLTAQPVSCLFARTDCHQGLELASRRRLSAEVERRKSLRLVDQPTPAHSMLLVVGLLACACSGASTRSLGPDTWRVQCKSSMATCAAKADELCSDRGYIITSGRSYKQIYGPEGQQVADERGELVVHCGTAPTDRKPDAGDEGQPGGWRLPSRPSGQPAEKAAPDPSGRPGQRACTPGETQMCVGPAACRGGQACRSDGSGFEPCDCGSTGTQPSDASDAAASGTGPISPSAPSGGSVR